MGSVPGRSSKVMSQLMSQRFKFLFLFSSRGLDGLQNVGFCPECAWALKAAYFYVRGNLYDRSKFHTVYELAGSRLLTNAQRKSKSQGLKSRNAECRNMNSPIALVPFWPVALIAKSRHTFNFGLRQHCSRTGAPAT